MRLLIGGLFATSMLAAMPASAQSRGAVIRVVDVGPGLCVVASFPGGHDLLYDAGHWESTTCRQAVRDMVADRTIELVILSHMDSDHIGELDDILADNQVVKIIHTADPRTTQTYRRAMEAIEEETGIKEIVIGQPTTDPVDFVEPDTVLDPGPAKVKFMAGWHEWNNSWSTGSLESGEKRNVFSIVVRVEYRGKSILLTGDSIGRKKGSADTTCDHAERWMANKHGPALRSTVITAPHHGGDNGSSRCFIDKVMPQYVIFSSGHDHKHPTAAAAGRYMAAPTSVRLARIFRTDYGDDEGGYEWTQWRKPGCVDGIGDDSVEIRFPASRRQRARVRYLSTRSTCP